MIYADNAATTPLSPIALEAMEPFLHEEYYNASTKYSKARIAKRAVENARGIIAKLIDAKPHEVFCTSGGTESDNWAIKGTMFASGLHSHMITDQIEHHAVLASCNFLSQLGYSVDYLPPNAEGVLTSSAASGVLKNGTKLVSIMLINNELGTIQPIADIAYLAHKYGAVFHTDAVQAMGHIPVNVNKLGIDMLSASAHKFGGPKGVGFLYVKEGTNIQPLMSGGGQESGLRAGTVNVAGIVGMAAALQESVENIPSNLVKLSEMRKCLLASLGESSLDYKINGGGNVYPGIISISLKGFEAEVLMHRLDLLGIQVSTGSACNSYTTQISHVLQSIGLEKDYAEGTIRISFGTQNSIDDALAIAEALKKICSKSF